MFDMQQDGNADVKIYTDGSATEDGVGAAYAAYDAQMQVLQESKRKLPKYSNNFEAEGVAILKALEYISTLEEGLHVRALTDSLSTLKALSNAENTNCLINQIKLKCQTIQNHFLVHFTFVKGHIGIIGNEQADELAKDAVARGLPTEVPMTKRFINKELTTEVFNKWQLLWIREGRESPTYQWIKNVKHIPLHFPTNRFTSQALTGHGRFPFYFLRFGIQDNQLCKCGANAESIDHYLEDCNLSIQFIDALKKRHRGKSTQAKPEIVKDKVSLDIVGTMIKDISQW